jgi:hypothetical protein
MIREIGSRVFLRRQNKIPNLAQRRVLARPRHPHFQNAGQIRGTRKKPHRPLPAIDGKRFAGDMGPD